MNLIPIISAHILHFTSSLVIKKDQRFNTKHQLMFWVLHTMRGEFQQFNKYSCFTDGQPGAQNTMPTEKQLVGETSSVHFSKILPWPSSMYGAVLGSLQVLSQTPSCPKLATPQGCSDHPYPGLQMCRLRL